MRANAIEKLLILIMDHWDEQGITDDQKMSCLVTKGRILTDRSDTSSASVIRELVNNKL